MENRSTWAAAITYTSCNKGRGRAELLLFPQPSCLISDSGFRRVDAQRGGERNQMVLLIDENGADGLAHGIFIQFLGLLQATAVLTDGLLFVVEVEAKHVLGLFRGLDRLGLDCGHTAEIVDRVGYLECVGEFFGGVNS